MGNKVGLFYNPVAGEGRFKFKLDKVIHSFQSHGLQLEPFRIINNADISKKMSRLTPDDYHTIVAAGGDGTINGVLSAMMKSGVNAPLGIFPEGTSNDVASYLGIPREVHRYCNVITRGKLMGCDVGKVNESYFVNVASAGFLTETAHEVDYRLKNSLGRLAYYLKAVEKLPWLKPFTMHVTIDGNDYQLEALLFILLNGGTAGGFKDILPAGSMNDGLMDFLAIKPAPPHSLGRILHSFYRGRLLEDDDVFYCQGQRISVHLNPDTPTDIDGEIGPPLPWEIEVLPSAIQIRVP
ncbi:MAG: YegS/Rv2252/BmrU family lipid kinase [Syntrophomonadaceae bacterium]|nr:YegS/Rv2252/BmrU family lipid kinase [Syntrophomonadaceae bacterium]